MRKPIWLTVMMLFVMLGAFSGGQTIRAAESYTDLDGHFSFTPPDNYQQFTTQQVSSAVRAGSNALGVSGVQNQIIVAYRAPLNTANANVGAAMLPDPNETLDDAVMAERDILGSIDAVAITLDESQETMLGSEPARSFEYALSLNGVDLRGKQFVALHNGAVYFITFTSLAASADRSFEEMQGIVDTFMFLD